MAARRHLGKNAKRSVGFLLCISICVGAANAAAVENPNSNSSNPPVERQPSASELKILDDLLQAGRTVDLAATLQSGRFPERDLRAWLERRAEEGHPYPQFELAERLRERDAELALKWYARARMALVLDYAECARSTESGVLEWALEAKYKKLDELARKEKGKFAVGMKEAVDREQSPHPSRSPKWICGESNPPSVDGNVLPSDRRQAERRKAFDQLVQRAKDIAAEAQFVAPGFSLTEIPYAGGHFVWIDNEKVLFIGGPANRPASFNPQYWLYVWNTSTGEVKELSQLGRYPALCYDRGYVRLSFDRGEERVIREGTLGHEVEREIRRPAPKLSKNTYFNPYNCRDREVPSGTRPDYSVFTLLRDDHGFIEIERPHQRISDHRYFLVRPSGERTEIKLSCGAGGPKFSEFKQAYIFQDGSGVWSESIEKKTCAIGVDGTVTEYKMPKGRWMVGSTFGMPVKPGLLISSRSDAKGLYLIGGDQSIQRIVSASINSFAVSGNGCEAAINFYREERGGPRIGLLAICKGGGGSDDDLQ